MTTIVRLRGATTDVDGDPSGSATSETLTGCFVAPRTSSDVDAPGRNGAVIGLSLYGPLDTDLVRTDQVQVDGITYQIIGDVGLWANPLTGWEAGFEAALERGEG